MNLRRCSRRLVAVCASVVALAGGVGVDDTKWGTFTPSSLPASATWVFNKPFYVVLNLAVGGGWAGLPDSATEFPATMLVDRVNWEPA